MAATTQNPQPPFSFQAIANSTVDILVFARNLLTQKNNLSRSQYSNLLKENGWTRTESKLYIAVAKAFSNFAPQDLALVEPQTIYKLAKSKTLAPVIAQMQNIVNITQKKVHELIFDCRKLAKESRKKVGIWVMGADGLPVCRIPDIVEPDFTTGATIEKAMEQTGLRAVQVVSCAVEFWGNRNDILPLHPEDYATAKQLKQSWNRDTSQKVDSDTNHSDESTPAPVSEETQEMTPPTPEQPVAEETQEMTPPASEQPIVPVAEETQEMTPPAPKGNLAAQVEQPQENTGDDLYQKFIESKVDRILAELANPLSWDDVVYITANCCQEIKQKSWDRIDRNKQNYLRELKRQHIESFNVGDRVEWPNCPHQLNSWAPYVITSINGFSAIIDIYDDPIPLAELVKV